MHAWLRWAKIWIEINMRNYLLLWDPFLDSTFHKLVCFYYTKCAYEWVCVCADHKHVKNTFNAPSLTCRNSLRIWTKIITVITTIKTRSDQTKRLQYPKIKHTSQLQHHWTLWNLSCMNGKKQTKKEERNKSFTNNRNSIYARNAIHSYT